MSTQMTYPSVYQVPSPCHTWGHNMSRIDSIPSPRPRFQAASDAPAIVAETTTTKKAVKQLDYTKWPLTGYDFRIIQLDCRHDGSFSATIVRRRIRTGHAYVALSYAWGDRSKTKMMRIEGEKVKVPISLYEALHAVARAYSGKRRVMVWADALCIDQSNLEEKSQQVSIMASIYQNAQSVAIWLGPERNGDADTAHHFLNRLRWSPNPSKVLEGASKEDLYSVALLFSRPYWSRLWVLQEIYNAKKIFVYYGKHRDTWATFQHATEVFQSEGAKCRLDEFSQQKPGREQGSSLSSDYLSYSQILMYQGPASFSGILGYKSKNDARDPNRPFHEAFQCLLEIMRLSRSKKVLEVRDRVFAIRGVLPERIHSLIKIDYNASLREIYTRIFDLVVGMTGRLDIMCESIHFPLYRGVVELPSWLPDWSHMPMVSSLAAKYPGAFHADAGICVDYDFESRPAPGKRIRIEALVVGKIHTLSTALNTGCRATDYIRAFEGWRLELMNHFRPASADTEDKSAWDGKEKELASWLAKEEEFCQTISLGKAGKEDCYPIFASMIRSRFPYQPLDGELKRYAEGRDVTTADRRLLQENFGENMMGRCFCVTSKGDLGLGSGLMCHGDLVAVALGCCTPIILRSQGVDDAGDPVYRFVGDIYLHGYMNGEAMGDRALAREMFLIQ